MEVRLLVIAGAAVVIALAAWAYRRRARADQLASGPFPPVPASLRGDAERTWLVFTTPTCASCGPVQESLRAAEPSSRVVAVDATRHPDLAGAFAVKRAPTVVLAGPEGEVEARLVGAEAVHRHLAVATA